MNSAEGDNTSNHGPGGPGVPGPATGPSAVEVQARAMFTRVLSAWACDLLRLRRAGLDMPGHRAGKRDVVTPAFTDRGSEPRWAGDVASALRWRPAA